MARKIERQTVNKGGSGIDRKSRQAEMQLSVSRSVWRRTGLVLAALATAALFFFLGVLFRVLVGPVSLGPLNGELRSALRQQLPGLQLQFDDAALEWSRDEGRINLVIYGTRVFDASGRIIAQAPEAEIGLSAGPFLLGKVIIKRIALVGVQLTLVHTKSGALRLGTEHDNSESDILQAIRDAIAKSAWKGPQPLRSFAVRKARLAFFDEGTGIFVVAPQAELQIAGSDAAPSSAVIAAVDAQLEISGKPAHLIANLKLPRTGDTLTGDFSVTNVDVRALAANSRSFSFLRPFAFTADASGSFAFANGNSLQYADVGIGASGTLNGAARPLHIRSMRLVGRYDGRTGRFLLDDGSLSGAHAHGHASGSGNLHFDPAGRVTAVTYTLLVDELAANVPDVLPQNVSHARAVLRGSFLPATDQFLVDQALISGGPLSASLAGKVILAADRSPEIDIDGKVNAIAARDLLRFWPLGLGGGARDWIASNALAGRIGPVMVHTAIPAGALDRAPLPEGAMAISFPISGASLNYIKGLTPLTALSGVGQLSGDTFKADVTSAAIGRLAVSQGHVVIPNLHMHGMVGEISGHVEGALPDVLALADMKPLGYAARFHIKPAETKGAVSLDFKARVPMMRNLSVDAVAISATASVKGLSLALGPHTWISNGTANFDIGNTALHATGDVGFGSGTFAVDWVESFKSGPVTTRVHVRGMLDDATRTAFNLPTDQVLTGPVGLTADLEGVRGAIQSAQISADLTPASLGVDLLNIRKPAGTPASATVSAHLDEGGNIRTADISISGGTLSARGSATFGENGDLQALDLGSVRDGGLNDFALSMKDTPASGLNIVVIGRSADGTALGRKTRGSSNPDKPNPDRASEPFHVSARLDRLVLREGLNLAPFSLDVSGKGRRPETMALSAMLSKSAQLSASITSSETSRKLSLSSNDAGLLLKGLFGFTSIKSGQLSVSATMPPFSPRAGNPAADFSGQVTIRNCTVVNQAFLTRIFSSGSLVGFVDLMRGEGISIDTLQIPFQVNGDVIDIHDARASGPSIGITTDGYIDRANDQISLQGAIAPLYGLNGVLGSIPVLGNVFVSKKGEGIFGVTYRATGNADEPQVTVNPLSMLAPGIFRRIFEGAAPSAPPAQANSAPPKSP